MMVTDEEREIWVDRRLDDEEFLDDVSDAAVFYGDFPPFLDFPCMSSSSSPAPVKAIACSSSASTDSSSSSAAVSWAVLKSDADEDAERKNNGHNNHHHYHNQQDLVDGTVAALSSTASMEIPQSLDHSAMDGFDCMDVMENFGYIDLLDNNDFFDPSSIFHHDDTGPEQFQQEPKQRQEHSQQVEQELPMIHNNKNEDQTQELKTSDDLAAVFWEWLKTKKETVSEADLRRVKIKKATIECAAKRLGGGKEAMKQLLKLILEWVQTSHLQRRRNIKESASNINNIDHLLYQCHQDPFQNPNPSSNPNLNCNSVRPSEPNSCFFQSTWIPQPVYVSNPAAAAAMVPCFAVPLVGYLAEPFANGAPNVTSHPYQPPTDYQMVDSAQTWPASQFALAFEYNSFPDINLHFPGYVNQYPYQYVGRNNDQRLVRLGSSATKEARKKRLARQRRFASHHRNHNHHNNQQSQQHQNQSLDQLARLVKDNRVKAVQANTENWVYWPSVAAGGTVASKHSGSA